MTEAVRALILGEELLQLPARFNAFVDEQRQVNKRVESDISELKAGQARLEANIEDLNAGQRRIETRMDRQENDSSIIKDFYMGTVVGREAETLPGDFGLDYVRTLTGGDLDRILRAAHADLPLNERRSFCRADLVVEARDESGTVYIAVEASYTGDLRDSGRARRNARFLTEFTGHRAIPVVASIRNVNEVSALVDSGDVQWYELEDRYTPSE